MTSITRKIDDIIQEYGSWEEYENSLNKDKVEDKNPLDDLEHYAPKPSQRIYIVGHELAGMSPSALARLHDHAQKHNIEIVDIEEGLNRIAELEKPDPKRFEITIVPRLTEEAPVHLQIRDNIPVPRKYKRNRFSK